LKKYLNRYLVFHLNGLFYEYLLQHCIFPITIYLKNAHLRLFV